MYLARAKQSTVRTCTGKHLFLRPRNAPSRATRPVHAQTKDVQTASAAVGLAVQLGEMAQSINSVAIEGITNLFSGVARAIRHVHETIDNEWEPADVWYIVAWRFLHKPLLRAVFYAVEAIKLLLSLRKPMTTEARLAPFNDPSAYQNSLFGFLEKPFGELTYVFTALWAYDMTDRVAKFSARLSAGIDECFYTVWAVMLVVRLMEHYIPKLEAVQRIEANSPGSADSLVRLSSLAVYVLGAAGVLQSFGLTAGAIGLASVGGLAFSLASRSLVENLMGGIFLVMRQPFKVGDNVELKDAKGKISKIGWLTTEILQPSGSPVFVNNSAFISSTIVNRSRNSHTKLEVDFTLFIQDADKAPQVLNDIEEYLATWPLVDWPGRTPASTSRALSSPRVGVTEISEEGLTISVTCYLGPCPGKDSETLFFGKSELHMALVRILSKHGCRLGKSLELDNVEGYVPPPTIEPLPVKKSRFVNVLKKAAPENSNASVPSSGSVGPSVLGSV